MRRPQRVLGSMDEMHAWERSQAGDRFDRLPGRVLGIIDVETWRSSRPRYRPLTTTWSPAISPE